MDQQIVEQSITDKSTKSLEIKLNIGSGANKLEGFLNIDTWEGAKPDLIHDITKESLPFQNETVDEIVFFHCIEHIQEKLHDRVLGEMFRVLKLNGSLIISYPEFLKCVENYATNYKGQRDFFKATIYGRQSHVGDFHVSLMDTPFLVNRLRKIGFDLVKVISEPVPNEFNTVVKVTKGKPFINREELLREEIFNR